MKKTPIRLYAILLVHALCVGLSGCLYMEDQRLASPEVKAKLKPAPTPRDFRAQDARHKVLIAIIDSGVDYNHPELTGSIQFDTDAAGNAIGTGWDYTAQDSWPSPYIARTVDIDPSHSQKVRDDSGDDRKHLQEIIDADHDLASFLDPDRNIAFEQLAAAHGTHVAGIAAQLDSRIGIVPYRIAANVGGESEASLRMGDIALVLMENLKNAVENASAHGVRVINLSLTLGAAKSDVKDFDSVKEARKKFKELVAAHPEMAFIAAAGNDHTKITTESLSFPCGIQQPNIICVTALDKSGKRADFSNTVDPNLKQVSASGVAIRSVVPWQMCLNHEMPSVMNPAKALPQEKLISLAQHLKDRCFADRGHALMSGTSMAAPLVAGTVALIMLEDAKIDGAEAIQTLLRKYPKGIQVN